MNLLLPARAVVLLTHGEHLNAHLWKKCNKTVLGAQPIKDPMALRIPAGLSKTRLVVCDEQYLRQPGLSDMVPTSVHSFHTLCSMHLTSTTILATAYHLLPNAHMPVAH